MRGTGITSGLQRRIRGFVRPDQFVRHERSPGACRKRDTLFFRGEDNIPDLIIGAAAIDPGEGEGTEAGAMGGGGGLLLL